MVFKVALVGLLVWSWASTPVIAEEVIARDESLVKFDTGLVHDTASGLDWFAGPDRGMGWEEARSWVSDLDVLGGGWRMPSPGELDTLFRVGDGVRNITHLIDNTGYWLWAGQVEKTAARWLFNFSYGGEGWSGQPPADGGRAIAVREHKEK
jgi:hypothetical protein